MPLMCQSPSGPEYSYRHDAESWALLRHDNAARCHLYMPCCRARVILKRSAHGTLFFAHARRDGCRTAPESPLHLFLKDVIARTAERLGYSAETESPGQSPDGAKWVVDVLCRGPDPDSRLAFEVQLSPQTIETTLARSALHFRSGVRTVWLMKQSDVAIDSSAPVAMLDIDPASGTPRVLLPSRFYRRPQRTRTSVANTRQWGQSVTLQHFVRCALWGQLRFSPVIGELLPLRVIAADAPCWQCNRSTSIVTGLELEADRRFPGFGNHTLDLAPLGAASPMAEAWIARYLPSDLLASAGIGPIGHRVDRVTGGKYLANGCVHCDALQYDFFTGPSRGPSRPVLQADVLFESWVAAACHHWASRWWLPDS